MNKICVIVGAGECGEIMIENRNNTFFIAADAGYETLKRQNISPDITIGDFDSLGKAPETDDLILLPVEKDDTDMAAAVKEGMKRGCKTFYLYGGCGGREDHTFANYQLLLYIAEEGGCGFLIGETNVSTVIKNSSFSFNEEKRGVVSVFAVGGKAAGVSIKGLKYKLENAVLEPSFPLGVSNKFIGERSEISVKSGALLIMFPR